MEERPIPVGRRTCDFWLGEDTCPRPAVWKFRERIVQDHLCGEHAPAKAVRLAAPAGACDRCNRVAMYAKMIWYPTYWCSRHWHELSNRAATK
jgi:hypothetical protein